MTTTYTVCAGFYDSDTRALVEVQASSIEEACEEACRAIDAGEASTDTRSWDPTETFVMAVTEGVGNPWNGDGAKNVPPAYQEGPTLHREAYAALELVREAIRETPRFDTDDEVNGGDLVDWFGGWRQRARAIVDDAPPAPALAERHTDRPAIITTMSDLGHLAGVLDHREYASLKLTSWFRWLLREASREANAIAGRALGYGIVRNPDRADG